MTAPSLPDFATATLKPLITPSRECGPWNPRNLDRAGNVGRAALIDAADQFASGLRQTVQAIRSTGAITLESIAIELNRRGIRSARGGKWHRSSVRNLLDRAELRV